MERIICTVTNDLTYDQRMIRICSSLSRAGYEVWLIGRELPSSKPLREQAFRQHRLRCHFQAGKLFYLEFNLRLLYWLYRQPFGALCAVDLDTILPAFWWCRLRKKPLVYDAHEYYTETPEVVRRPLTQKIWESVAELCIPRLKYAYTVGEMLAERFTERYGTPFAVIRNMPLNRKNTAPVSKPQPPVILYQGALNEGRGLETAIAAMPQMEHAQLWLAGEGDLSESLRQQAKELNVEDKVRFLGYLPPHELQELTPQAHIGLNLLENKGLSYYYSLANKTFDYMQAGVPAIHMAFPEYVRLQQRCPAFVLLEELSVDALSKKLKLLLQDKALYAQLQQACAPAAAELNWEREEEKLVKFWQKVMASP